MKVHFLLKCVDKTKKMPDVLPNLILLYTCHGPYAKLIRLRHVSTNINFQVLQNENLTANEVTLENIGSLGLPGVDYQT